MPLLLVGLYAIINSTICLLCWSDKNWDPDVCVTCDGGKRYAVSLAGGILIVMFAMGFPCKYKFFIKMAKKKAAMASLEKTRLQLDAQQQTAHVITLVY